MVCDDLVALQQTMLIKNLTDMCWWYLCFKEADFFYAADLLYAQYPKEIVHIIQLFENLALSS